MKFLCIVILAGVISMHSPNLNAQEKLTVHYNRVENDYSGWKLWVWNETDKKKGMDLLPLKKDDFGLVFEIDILKYGFEGKKIGLLPKYKNWRDKDAPNRFYVPDSPGARDSRPSRDIGKPQSLPNGEDSTLELFILQDEPDVYPSRPKNSSGVDTAWLDAPGIVRVVLTRRLKKDFIAAHPFYIETPLGIIKVKKVVFPDSKNFGKTVRLYFNPKGKIDLMSVNCGEWTLHFLSGNIVTVYPGKILDSADFASSMELGVVKEKDSTVIRVFAPAACEAYVLLYSSHDSQDAVKMPMKPVAGGVWEFETKENIEGRYYRIGVMRNGKEVQGIDPYSRCNTAHDGKGLIINDLLRRAAPVEKSPVLDISEAIIYEMHIRDFTIDPQSGIMPPVAGKYLGAAQVGTRHQNFPEIKTGLDHLVELGINTVQILPVQDFRNNENSDEYHWGYMPVHFNSPDGWYATQTHNSRRVEELKRLISALHKKGMRVVMDVVYNHTAETPQEFYGFNVMAENYYYRQKADGSYYNGSGCGNEFRSESPMGRKFILDSLKYWVREYNVDGFRFDLMALIDMETMETIVKELRALKSDILIYGEPWSAGPTPIQKIEKGSQRSKGFAVFNDNFRDAIKGGVFDLSKGYVQAGLNRGKIMKGITGSIDDFCDSPLETINYVSCHDNHTLWDRITLSLKGEATTTLWQQKAMDKLSAAIVLTSQGVPFIHSGAEFLRTKKGEENSYNLGDSINMIDWSLKKTNRDVFEYYRDLIALRKAHPAFRMKTAREIRKNLKFYEDLKLPIHAPCIGYVIDGENTGDSWKKIVVLINPEKKKRKFVLPGGSFKVVMGRDPVVRSGGKAVSGKVDVPPISLMILKN